MAASPRRSSSAVPPLTQALNVLNAPDSGADVETLWTQLRQAFSREQSSNGPAAFPIFAFAEVRRPILEIATEQQYKNDLSNISKDQNRRLRSITKQLNISPAIFCFLFTPECAASRTCTNSLAELQTARPDLSLSSILQVFVSQSATLETAKRRRRCSSRVPQTALKNTIQHFDKRIWQQQAPSTAKRHVKTFRTRPAKLPISALSDISEEHSPFPTLPEDRQPTPVENEDQAVNNASDEDKEYIISRDNGDATSGDGEHSCVETDKETFTHDFEDTTYQLHQTDDTEANHPPVEASRKHERRHSANNHDVSPLFSPILESIERSWESVTMNRPGQKRKALSLASSPLPKHNYQTSPLKRIRRDSHSISDSSSTSEMHTIGITTAPEIAFDTSKYPTPVSRYSRPSSLPPLSPLPKPSRIPGLPPPLQTSPPIPVEASMSGDCAGQSQDPSVSRVDLRLRIHSQTSLSPGMFCNDDSIMTLMRRIVPNDVGIVNSLAFQLRHTNSTRNKLQSQLLKPAVLMVYNHPSPPHWSLFRWSRSRHTLEHYDSCQSLGLGAIAGPKVETFLRWAHGDGDMLIHRREMECTQQDNGTDCGIFTLLFAKQVGVPDRTAPLRVHVQAAGYRDYFCRSLLTSSDAVLQPHEICELGEYLTESTAERAAQLADVVDGARCSKQLLARRRPGIRSRLRRELDTATREEIRLARLGSLAGMIRNISLIHKEALRDACRIDEEAKSESEAEHLQLEMQRGLDMFVSAYTQLNPAMGPIPISEESADGLKLGLEGLLKSARGLQTLWRVPQPDVVARAARVRSQYRRSVVWLLVLRRAVQNFRRASGEHTERYGS